MAESEIDVTLRRQSERDSLSAGISEKLTTLHYRCFMTCPTCGSRQPIPDGTMIFDLATCLQCGFESILSLQSTTSS